MSEALRFDISAKDEFSKAFDKLKNHLPSVKTLAIGATTAIAGTGAALFAVAKTTATAYDKLSKFSDQTGLSTEFLSKMGVAAKFTDVDIGTMNKSLERLQVGIGEASKGIGTAKDTLADMGIELTKENGQLKTTEDILPELADRLQNMTNVTQRTEAAQKLFGQRGLEMIKILKDGSEGLKAYSKEAEALGLVVDKKAAENAAKFKDALFKVQGVLTGLKNEIGEKVIPIITGLADKFTDFVKNNRSNIIAWASDLIKTFGYIAQKGVESIAFLIDAWQNLRIVWAGLKVKYAEFMNYIIGANDRESEEDKKRAEQKKIYREQLQQRLLQLEKELEQNYTSGKAAELAFTRDMLNKELAAYEESKNRKISLAQNVVDAINEYNDLLLNPINAREKTDKFIEELKRAFNSIQEYGESEISNQAEKNEILNTMKQEQDQFDLDAFQSKLDELQSMHDDYFLSEQQKLDKWLNTERTKHEGNHRALTKLSQIYTAKQQEIDQRNLEFKKQVAEQEFQARMDALSKIASLGKVFGKEFFNISKSASLARAVINTYTSATEAFAKAGGFPWGVAAAAASIAYGMAQVKQISAQQYAHGGLTNVPREQTLTVTQGERILSPEQNKDFTNFISNGAGGASVTIENMNILPNATNAEALLYMDQTEWEEIAEKNILPALRKLDIRGLTI